MSIMFIDLCKKKCSVLCIRYIMIVRLVFPLWATSISRRAEFQNQYGYSKVPSSIGSLDKGST